jgi:Cu/Ag efflux pump CusA
MRVQGLNANILSLGGIAIAIGAMVDAAVVMIENAHKHLERWAHDNPDQVLTGEARWRVITDAAAEVGPALFLSLLIITFSFIPIFSLQGQEGRLFAPLAFTKTYAMAGAALLSITLIPVLMGWLIRGKSRRRRQPDQPFPDPHLSPRARLGAGEAQSGAADRVSWCSPPASGRSPDLAASSCRR